MSSVNNLPFSPLVALGALVFTGVNFLKYLSARDWNAAVTQLVAWAGGIAVVVLFAQTQFAQSVAIGELPLAKASIASLLLIGLMATSLLSTVNEVKKAIDNTDNANTPPLFPAPTMRAGKVKPPPRAVRRHPSTS